MRSRMAPEEGARQDEASMPHGAPSDGGPPLVRPAEPGTSAGRNSPSPRIDPRWVLIVPVALVAGLAAWAFLPYGGTTVHLATEPYDPTDPFRGDYQVLRYDLNTVSPALPGYANIGPVGSTVYVRLEPSTELAPTERAYWHAVEISHEPVGDVCLRGQVAETGGSRIVIAYGIESYFVQKDQTFEDWIGKTVSVDVKVSNCTGRIANIFLDGQKWDG